MTNSPNPHQLLGDYFDIRDARGTRNGTLESSRYVRLHIPGQARQLCALNFGDRVSIREQLVTEKLKVLGQEDEARQTGQDRTGDRTDLSLLIRLAIKSVHFLDAKGTIVFKIRF